MGIIKDLKESSERLINDGNSHMTSTGRGIKQTIDMVEEPINEIVNALKIMDSIWDDKLHDILRIFGTTDAVTIRKAIDAAKRF